MGRIVGIVLLVAPVAAIVAATAVSATSLRVATPNACALLTRAEIADVMTGRPGAPRAEAAIPYPPDGKACSWLSAKAKTTPHGVVQAVVELWDFRRTTDAAFRTRYGTGAKRFVRQRCTQKAPAGSGVELPTTKPLSGVGDAACTVSSQVDVAKGPYFLIVTAGSLDEGAQHVGAAVQLTKNALRRLSR